MKMMVTGGNRGLGKALVDHYHGDTFSRSNGYDITSSTAELSSISLDYDVFVNNAFDGPFQESWADFGQTKLLWAVADAWRSAGKSGLIINIGSVGTEIVSAPTPDFETYRVAKQALKSHSRQWSRAFKENQVRFRTTLLTLDRLDTELSRSRESWTGNGIEMTDVISCVDLLCKLNPNTCIEEITAWVNFNHN